MKTRIFIFCLLGNCVLNITGIKCQILPATVLMTAKLPVAFSGSKIKLSEGTAQKLKGIERMPVVFDYSRMSVSEFHTEAEYLANKQKEYGEKKAKKFDKFKERWKLQFKEAFEPKFEKEFNVKNMPLKLIRLCDSLATFGAGVHLEVEVFKIDPRKNKSSNDNSKMPSTAKFVCSFLQNNGELAARFIIDANSHNAMTIKGSMEECYAIAGKLLADEIAKRLRRPELDIQQKEQRMEGETEKQE